MSSNERRAPSPNRRGALGLTLAAALGAAGCVDTPSAALPNPDLHAYANEENILAMRGIVDPDRLAALAAAFAIETDPAITFDFDRAELEPAALAALQTQADWLIRHPSVLVAIYGHADLVGSSAYNDRLGLRRAAAAARALVEMGVDDDRLLLVASRGERDPIVPTEERERLNRRVATVVEGYGLGWDRRRFDGKRAEIVYSQYTTDESEVVIPLPTGGG
ncbi:OmpA family protein [Albimonas sp. CAU 1670]|uniref:OmpA family protein n=1 Tax=Albimonas sp. CAU 1670 TaxID=3032599 RepID=UPI0023DC8FBE|nr:OmpA family protein [Albimonas sp. CAU 1670]MDF2234423.1 OmpA family protein [Albimonas sp. CAU 1670]